MPVASKVSIKTCIPQVLARARERGDGEECGLEEEDSDRDSSEEEDIVTEFPISNGGNSSLAEVCLPSLKLHGVYFPFLYQADKVRCVKVLDLEDSRMREYEEGRRQPCEQVVAPSFCAGSLFSFFLCRLPLLFLSLQSPSFFASCVSFFCLSLTLGL